MLVLGRKIPTQLLDIGYWMLDIGYWILVDWLAISRKENAVSSYICMGFGVFVWSAGFSRCKNEVWIVFFF